MSQQPKTSKRPKNTTTSRPNTRPNATGTILPEKEAVPTASGRKQQPLKQSTANQKQNKPEGAICKKAA